MQLDAWLKQHGELGGWSNRQPLEPFPVFQNRCVAAGWEQVERYTLHQLRRGVAVPERLNWFRAIDEGWAEPSGMVHLIVPQRSPSPDAQIFHLGFSNDAEAKARELERESEHPLEVFQQWPGSPELAGSLSRALFALRQRGEWYRWVQDDLMSLGMAMDVVANAWAHRRYWFGLGA